MDQSEVYIRSKYPFIALSLLRMPQVFGSFNLLDQTSCLILANLCDAGMKTVDYIATNDTTAQTVPVQRLFNDMWEMFWGGWVSFNQIAQNPQGTQSAQFTSGCVQNITAFKNWDVALQPCPFNDIGLAFNTVISGVTLPQ